MHLFQEAITYRSLAGITTSLRIGHVNEIMDGDEGFTELVPGSKPDDCSAETCGCGCNTEAGETCQKCDPDLRSDVCSVEDVVNVLQARSPFQGIATLLTTVKKYEFVSLVESAYAQIGNKPFKLKPTREMQLSDAELASAAKSFFDFLDAFLIQNGVRVDEIPTAFNLDTLGQVTDALEKTAQGDADARRDESLAVNEAVLEKIFKRAAFMQQYMEVLKDTTDYPIGILWLDDLAMKRERKISGGKMSFNHVIQSDAKRIDPCFFWSTEDHKLNSTGRAVFKLEQFSNGDLLRWADSDVITPSKKIQKEIRAFLALNTDGYRQHNAMLFNDHHQLKKGEYDILISRGTYRREHLEQLNVPIPDTHKKDDYVPCEIYFAGTHVLRCRVMEAVDEHLGVYTTVFRRRGSSIYGYSLHEFIYPFAKMYEGAIEAIDLTMGKAVGSIIQVDTGVINNPDEYLKKNEKTGEITIDLTSDVVIEFDSTRAFASPNFKGVPIHVEQLPNDLPKLIPMLSLIDDELEKISGIPSILVSSQNVSSALRTTGNFNAAFAASSKGVQALLREGENRVLEPSIRFFFDSRAIDGEFGRFLNDLEPEILLSDTLSRERNEDEELVIGLQTLAAFGGQLIPPEKVAGLVNKVGREVYNLTEDLIPNTQSLSSNKPTAPVAPI